MKKKRYYFYFVFALSLVAQTVISSPEEDRAANIAASASSDPIYLGSFLNPWEIGDPNELVAFEFEDTELASLISYVEDRYGITFLLDDSIKPLPKGGKGVTGTKISFKTNEPLSKKEAWGIFTTFLDMSGLAATPGPAPRIYKISTIDPKSPINAMSNPLPTFIGVHPDLIPDNDTLIRYIYFVKDASMDIIKNVFDTMKSATSPKLIPFADVRGIVVTDKAYNIKAMLEIVNELDKVTMPETLSIIKLKRTDATKVAALYQELMKTDNQGSLASRLLGNRRPQTLSYFDAGTRIIPEPRTNTLILLGTEESVRKIEDFIVRKIDKNVETPYSPMHVYTLKYVQAEAVANILNKAVKFQTNSDAAKSGGVRDGDKYFKPVSIQAEKSGNRLIITADYEDYVKIHETIEKIDVEQPQVALKVLILNVDITDNKEFGAQVRNKRSGNNTTTGESSFLGQNVNFQTSGLGGTKSSVENSTGTGANRLLGDLVSLASGGSIGSTYLTLGADCFGVWGMFRMLEEHTNTNIVSNPFVMATNNYPAEVSLGETRRVKSGTTTGAGGSTTDSFKDIPANLSVFVTPQISYEGFVTLEIVVKDNQFTSTSSSSGDRTEKEVRTSVILANNEVLALGGLVKNSFTETESKVPVLGSLPGVGWLFKNKQKSKTKSSLLILISPEIVPPNDNAVANNFTAGKLLEAEGTITATDSEAKRIDPIHRWFFNDNIDDGKKMMDEFTQKEERYLHPTQKKKRDNSERKRKRLSDFL